MPSVCIMLAGISNLPKRRLKRKEMAFFKKISTDTHDPEKQNAVIMGRKTWASIPERFRPLTGRINIILSRNMKESPSGAYHAQSLQDAIRLVKTAPLVERVESIFVIGGCSVYEEAMDSAHACRLYLTRVFADYDCDTFMPPFEEKFKQIDRPPNVLGEKITDNDQVTEKDVEFQFEVYEKLNS